MKGEKECTFLHSVKAMITLIKNGNVVTSDNEFTADVLIEDEKIVAVGKALNVPADKVIDASGKYVFPGFIDQHTHFDALCNSGDLDTAPYETSKTAVLGGTTTIVDYAPQDPGKGLLDSIDYRINVRAKNKACVDFALHSLITEVNDRMFDEIKELPKIGVASIKAFMAYKGSRLHVDDGTLVKVMAESKKAGVTTFVHAENAEIIDMLQQDCVKAGNTAPKYHAVSRPPMVETEAARRAVYLAEQMGAPTFIVHISTKGARDAVAEAKAKKLPVYGETCTQYLTTTKEKLSNPDFNEAAKYVCSPALRDEDDLEAMWEGIKDGTLSAIVSDHCGIDLATLKQVGRDNFVNIPNGAPGVGDRVPMIWTKGVVSGKISKQRFVEVCSALPAKINGIYPRKGTIAVGSDADVVIYDPNCASVIRLEDNPNGIDYNIYEGTKISGKVDTVLLRGKVVAEGGKFVGRLGDGKFIPSKAFALCFEK
ncbi:MAG: dihydropyrimidinase [Bacillota bacterium]|nr:dihydropyrimidinase [Bacillota bacterium]